MVVVEAAMLLSRGLMVVERLVVEILRLQIAQMLIPLVTAPMVFSSKAGAEMAVTVADPRVSRDTQVTEAKEVQAATLQQ